MIDKIRRSSGPLLGAIQKLLKNRLFLVTTAIPTMLAIIYFGIFASDIYVSESRFVVRSPDQRNSSPFGMIFKGAGFSKAQDDSYAVQDFILSRDALRSLEESLHIKAGFSSKKIDMLSRFPGMSWDESLESFYKYYEKKVTVQMDSESSISTLTTRAFTADEAFGMNQKLVELAENLVNKLNERGRQDMIRFADQEVSDAQTKAKAAAFALAKYRREQGVIDPEKQSVIPLQQIGKLQDELITTRSQVMQLEKLAKDNPQLPILRDKVILLERAIESETQRIVGGDGSLAGKAAGFQRLSLEKEFSEKMLASAMNTLEQARNEALRKQLYLERIVQPNKPDEAMEPRRLRSIVATFVVGMVLFGILSMLFAGIREHVD